MQFGVWSYVTDNDVAAFFSNLKANMPVFTVCLGKIIKSPCFRACLVALVEAHDIVGHCWLVVVCLIDFGAYGFAQAGLYAPGNNGCHLPLPGMPGPFVEFALPIVGGGVLAMSKNSYSNNNPTENGNGKLSRIP